MLNIFGLNKLVTLEEHEIKEVHKEKKKEIKENVKNLSDLKENSREIII